MRYPTRFVLACTALAAVCGASASRAATIAFDNSTATPNPGASFSLGLDFTVNAPISISSLGVFDNGATANLSGFDKTSGVSVGIFNVTTGLEVGPTITFTSSSAVTQVNADAFESVTPFTLGVGTYSIVAANDDYFNSQGNPNPSSTENTGGGLISFTGTGRFAVGAALTFPTNVDAGPANRYDAGTFQFVPVAATIPEPASLLLIGAGLLGLGMTRRKTS